MDKIVESEAEAQRPKPINERPIEFGFVFDCIREIQPAHILDVGTGQSALPALVSYCGCAVTAIDNIKDYWAAGMVNRHWLVQNEDIRRPNLAPQSFDAITCISVIEHIPEPELAFRSMINLLRPGGHLILTCPYNEGRYVEDVYQLTREPQPYRCSVYDRAILKDWLSGTHAQIVRQEYWRLWDGDLWRHGSRLAKPEKTAAQEPHHLTCLLIQKP